MTLLEQVEKHYSQTPVSAGGVLACTLTNAEWRQYGRQAEKIRRHSYSRIRDKRRARKRLDLRTAREHDRNA